MRKTLLETGCKVRESRCKVQNREFSEDLQN